MLTTLPMITFPPFYRRLMKPSLILPSLVGAVFACTGHSSPPTETNVSLATVAAKSTLVANVWINAVNLVIQDASPDGGTVRPEGPYDGPIEQGACAVLHATATLNGQPMRASAGSGAVVDLGGDNGCSDPVGNQCAPPSFAGGIVGGPPSAVDIVIGDESAKVTFHMDVPSPQVTIAEPEDAGLVRGASATLAFSPSLADASGVVIEFYGEGLDGGVDETGNPSFVCNGTNGLCDFKVTTTGASFVVPPVPAQKGTLVVSGLVVDPTNVTCSGVASCQLGTVEAQSVAIDTSVSP